MIIKQLSIFLENKSGRLAEISERLANEAINISAFSIADTSDYGILRLIVNNPDKAYKILKENGVSVSLTEVIGIIVPHQPGGLAKALKIFSEENISIEYMYAFAMGEKASVIIRTDNIQNAINVLQKHKMELIRASEIYEV